jgi:hypothetical protein
MLTGWCNKGIRVYLSALVGGEKIISLAFGVSSSAHGILVVEGDLERRLRGFVSGCFGVEALEAGIERLSRSAGVQMADGVLLIVCCESSHYERYIERVVCGVVYSYLVMATMACDARLCLPMVARAAGKRVWALERVRAEVVPFGSACPHYQLAHPDNSHTTTTLQHCAAPHPYIACSCRPLFTCKNTTYTLLYLTLHTSSSYGSD